MRNKKIPMTAIDSAEICSVKPSHLEFYYFADVQFKTSPIFFAIPYLITYNFCKSLQHSCVKFEVEQYKISLKFKLWENKIATKTRLGCEIEKFHGLYSSVSDMLRKTLTNSSRYVTYMTCSINIFEQLGLVIRQSSITWYIKQTAPRFNLTSIGYPTAEIRWQCYLPNGISYTGKMASSYWIRAQILNTKTCHSQSKAICKHYDRLKLIKRLLWEAYCEYFEGNGEREGNFNKKIYNSHYKDKTVMRIIFLVGILIPRLSLYWNQVLAI